MEPVALNKEMNWVVKARLLQKGTGAPLKGPEFCVRLFDRDFFEDDYLGECEPNAEGHVLFAFDYLTLHTSQFDNPLPDFFFVVYARGKVIFQSKVMQDVDFHRVGDIKMGVGVVVDLGTFLIEV